MQRKDYMRDLVCLTKVVGVVVVTVRTQCCCCYCVSGSSPKH